MFPAQKIHSEGHEIRSLDGRVRVPFKWLGTHPVSGEAGLVFIYPAGARFPVVRRRPGREQPWSLEAVTTGAHSTALAGLLEAGGPVGVYHAKEACHAAGCQIPEFQVVWVSAYPSERSDIDRVARRVWRFEMVPADESAIGPVGGFLWEDVAAQWGTWGGMQAVNASWKVLADREAQV